MNFDERLNQIIARHSELSNLMASGDGIDSDEFVNLAQDPKHQNVITRLAKWLPSKATPEFKEKSERLRARIK